MVNVPEEQKKIANLLLSGPRGREELQKKLGISKEAFDEVIVRMLKLKLVSKNKENCYVLKQEIVDEVLRRRAIVEVDSFRIRLRVIIDLQAIEKGLLKKHTDKVVEALKKEKLFTIYGIHRAKPAKEGEMYSSFIEVDLSVKNFSSAVRLLFYYGASSVEVLKPDKLTLSQYEFQEGLVELAMIFQNYSKYFLSKMTDDELRKFHNKMYD
ncbi:MAG: hypothetical protein WC308_00170 [archaeon]|jgi:hypothetical protein